MPGSRGRRVAAPHVRSELGDARRRRAWSRTVEPCFPQIGANACSLLDVLRARSGWVEMIIQKSREKFAAPARKARAPLRLLARNLRLGEQRGMRPRRRTKGSATGGRKNCGQIAQLPFQQGGLNLRSAVALAPAAYWASWADTLPVLHRQLPRFAADVVARLGAGEPVGPTLRGVLQSQAALAAAGFDLPTWDAVILGAQAPPQSNEPGDHLPEPSARGWQAPAAAAVAAHLQTELLAQLDVPSQALLFSQTGPFSSRPFTTVPTCPELTFPSEPLRALLLRRLRLPLPLSARTCRCRRPLDPLGDHRAASITTRRQRALARSSG